MVSPMHLRCGPSCCSCSVAACEGGVVRDRIDNRRLPIRRMLGRAAGRPSHSTSSYQASGDQVYEHEVVMQREKVKGDFYIPTPAK
jgi:hypothetical protein